MPQSEEETGNSVHVLAVFCVILIFTVTGGSLLLTYIVLPENRYTSWYLFVGIALAGIPWLFWFASAAYRFFVEGDFGEERSSVLPVKGGGLAWPKPLVTGRMAVESPVGSPAGDRGANLGGAASDSPAGSPAAGRRVRFGGVVVLGSGKGGGGKPAAGSDVVQFAEERGKGDGVGRGGGALT